MRRAAQVDANQARIVEALRKVGAYVQSLASVGCGCPDLLVGWRGRTYLLEVKDGSRPPCERRLRESQARWHSEWRGRPALVVESVEQALAAIGLEGP